MGTECVMSESSDSWESSAFEHVCFKKANSPYTSHTVILGSEYAMPDLLEYSYNSHNFRSKEFHENTEIVALGCSHTFGVGVPEELTWPTFVKELTGVDDVVNLGKPGSSIGFQVRMLSIYIRTYGPPKVVLCNFPEVLRYEYINERGVVLSGHAHKGLDDYSYTEEQSSAQSLIALGMLEAMCKSNNITLRWQTWIDTSPHIEHGFSKYFEYYVSNKYKNAQFILNNPYVDELTNEVCGLNGNSICAEDCCIDLKNRSNGCFNFGYDRYLVPKKYQKYGLIIEKEKLEKLKNSTFRVEGNQTMGHLGSHAHWHWAKNLVDSLS